MAMSAPEDPDRTALPPGAVLQIAQAARRFGFSTSALRHYDALGLVVPGRRDHGQRHYARHHLRRLALVALARRLGIPLEASAR